MRSACLVARRAEHRLCEPPRRPSRGLRHERRREREAERHAGSGERRLSNLVSRRAEDRVLARPLHLQAPAVHRSQLRPLCRERRRQRAAQADDAPRLTISWSGRRTGRRSTSGATSSAPTGAERGGYVHTVDRRLVARRAADRFARKPGRTGFGPCCYSSHSDINVMNADGSGNRKVTHDARQNAEPAWSPDGRKIAFVSRETAQRGLRHQRRRKREAEPHAEPGEGRPSFLVPGRPKDRLRQQPRRASRGPRHERRWKRQEGPTVQDG